MNKSLFFKLAMKDLKQAKVALLHDHLNQAGGAERVLLAIAEIFPKAPIYTVIYDNKRLKGFENHQIKTSLIQSLPAGKTRFKWYLPLMPTAIEEIDLSQYDIVISSASGLIKGVITHPETLHICYCHTPTRYLWSDTHQYRKELNSSFIIKKLLPPILSKLRTWDQLSAQRVNNFIANSYFVSERIKNYYNRESEVIYPPVNIENFKLSDQTDNYFLIISRLRPYKKIDLAIKAFNKINMPLKIIGTGEEADKLRRLAKDNIEFLGSVAEQEKIKYLSRCLALIHPQEEDFGITPIEAMASGRPVIAYGKGGALETVKESLSGKLFYEQTWEDLSDAVIRFNPAEYDSLKIKEFAQQFSCQNFQAKLKNFLDCSWREFQTNKF